MWKRLIRRIVCAIAAMYLLICLSLVELKWVNPTTTAVQAERRLDAALHRRPYRKEQWFVPLNRISLDLQHAVIAGEDFRFRRHHGVDWVQIYRVVARDVGEKAIRRDGASTITQQLIKNLYLTPQRSVARKIFELSLAPITERILGKDRILELYLNVIEWGPGIYGIESAARHYFGVSADRLTREQAARLAAIVPNPLGREPVAMNHASTEILARMERLGW